MKVKKNIIWILLALFFGSLVSGVLFFRQQQFYESQNNVLEEILQRQVDLEETIRTSNLVALMGNILDKVDDELKNNPGGLLSEETIARIAALSYSFAPYSYEEGDSLATKKYSPERGQLLLALANVKMDSSSFRKIKLKTSFLGAALSGANLEGFDLSGIDLRGANLKEADLRRTNLSMADLKEVNLWGANLRGANLEGANLRRANMAWVDLKDGEVRNSILTGVDMTSAKLGGLDFTGADLKWVNFSHANLKAAKMSGIEVTGADCKNANLGGANMSDSDLKYLVLTETNLRKADLTNSNLTSADLSRTDIVGANFTGVELYKITFEEKKWFEKLKEWEVKGIEDIKERYIMGKDQSLTSNYWLVRKK